MNMETQDYEDGVCSIGDLILIGTEVDQRP